MKIQKVALVTGSSSGIGKEIAQFLLTKGYFVIITGRNKKGLEDFSQNNQAAIITGDITKDQTRTQLVQKVVEKGRLDILINNAGITFIQPFENNTKEQLDLIFETNVKASMLLTHDVIETLKKQQSGTIVFINSAAGKQGYPNHTMYSATKFALNGFAQSLRQEVKKYGIRVISVHPGGVKTNLYDSLASKPDISTYMEPKKIAEVVVYLIETEDMSPDEISLSRMNK